MAFTMFTSTPKEKICKGQKRYHLLPYEKKSSDEYTYAPLHMREREKVKRLKIKKIPDELRRGLNFSFNKLLVIPFSLQLHYLSYTAPNSFFLLFYKFKNLLCFLRQALIFDFQEISNKY